ncbi:MAG TPA: ATP-binding cassette domain-containing protein [Nevskiaceae bacterium]|nr:ATP-binding cassette domain-containing protein [Nevskiaceae bacterium]
MADPVEVEHLVAAFDDRVVLNDVSLAVREGEIMVIMGGSGSGKSTFLRHLLGLHRPRSGAIRLLGTDVTRATEAQWLELRRRLGVAFQSGALLSSLTVGDNIMLPLREHTRLDLQTMQIMMRLKLDFVNLAGCEDLTPAQLSGGMTKRAALARAIIMDPKLLFLDEPSAGLDPVVAAALDELILKLRDATGMTLLVVTHELESAFKIADRLCVLDRGEVIAVGSVAEVRASANPRVQALLTRKVEHLELNPAEYVKQLTGEKRTLRVN